MRVLLPAAGLFAALMMTSTDAHAERRCTLLVDADSGAVIARDGALCDERTSPASSFKVALSLMGYDAGILADAHHPEWPYKDEYNTWNDAWKRPTDPTAWLKDSVVWYSQVLTRTMGMARFQKYVDMFDYGNRDLRGDPGELDGLTTAWLGSSLQISPVEQAAFIGKLLRGELPVSRTAIDRTMAIMPAFPLPNGWTVFGKTGTGDQFDAAGKRDRTRMFGWFVGWARRDTRRAIFVRLLKDDAAIASSAGLRARDSLLADLPALLPGR
jgi:beta-lactamase class D